MAGIRDECNKVIDSQNIYAASITKSLRLDDFKQVFLSIISSTYHYLSITWSNDIQTIIETEFNNIGKGWFNMNETSKET